MLKLTQYGVGGLFMMCLKKYRLLLLLSFICLFYPMLEIKAQVNITLEAHLPTFSDETFSERHIRIETFGREACPYCELLKTSLYPALDETFDSSQLAARYLNIEHPQVKSYLLAKEQQFDLDQNLHGAVPATIINGTYLILGYNEQSTDFYIDLIQRIQNEEDIDPNPDHYLYVIDEASYPNANLQFFQLANLSSLFPLFFGMLVLALLTGFLYYQRANYEKNIVSS